jgi:hypothetical protein
MTLIVFSWQRNGVLPMCLQSLPLAVCGGASKLRTLIAFNAILISVITKTDDDIDF